jgi:ribosomal protein S18 acetylase RimI-like enzyme
VFRGDAATGIRCHTGRWAIASRRPARPHRARALCIRRAGGRTYNEGSTARRRNASPAHGAALDTPPLRLKADWQYAQQGARQHYTIQARIGSVLAGRAHGWFEPGGRFVLEKVEMAPRYRSKGHGSALIEALREKARASGCTEFVFHGVREANAGAIRLYEAMGARGVATSDGLMDFVITPP